MKIYIASSRPIGVKCKAWAEQLNIYKFVDSIDECDILISILYRDLIKPEQLKKLTRAFNFHVGLLPEYRGSACHNWAIINKESITGVTLHEIDDGIDTGPILDAFPIRIADDETADSLLKKAELLIFDMFKAFLHDMVKGGYEVIRQDPSLGHTYYRKDLQTAKDLTHFVRAFTFEDKEPAFYINAKGEKIYLRL